MSLNQMVVVDYTLRIVTVIFVIIQVLEVLLNRQVKITIFMKILKTINQN